MLPALPAHVAALVNITQTPVVAAGSVIPPVVRNISYAFAIPAENIVVTGLIGRAAAAGGSPAAGAGQLAANTALAGVAVRAVAAVTGMGIVAQNSILVAVAAERVPRFGRAETFLVSLGISDLFRKPFSGHRDKFDRLNQGDYPNED